MQINAHIYIHVFRERARDRLKLHGPTVKELIHRCNIYVCVVNPIYINIYINIYI